MKMTSGHNNHNEEPATGALQGSKFAASEFSELLKVAALFIFGILPFLAGVILVGFQAWSWLSTGLWPSWSLIDGLALIGAAEWIAGPAGQSLGHTILDAIPFSLALVGLSGVSFWISDRFD